VEFDQGATRFAGLEAHFLAASGGDDGGDVLLAMAKVICASRRCI